MMEKAVRLSMYLLWGQKMVQTSLLFSLVNRDSSVREIVRPKSGENGGRGCMGVLVGTCMVGERSEL